ncbi:MAG: nucleotidyltransferase domain-containing protein [Acidimicrobiia bacterium]
MVDRAVRRWAADLGDRGCDVVRFGSYARGDWGVGSDLDLVIIVDEADLPFEKRGVEFATTGLPVPADLVVHTREEWGRLCARPGFHRTLDQEAVWVEGSERPA